MFRPTSPQTSMLESQFVLPPAKRRRLEKSWAHVFRTLVMPAIDEEVFRECFDDDDAGRPNKSIRLLVGLHLLKEWDDLTDRQVLDQLEYNLQWHYALGVEPGTAHTCQKTLHNFRVRLMQGARAKEMFESITCRLVQADGLSFGRQRLDSTHVISNIAVLTRLGLFVETITKFLRQVRREAPDRLEALDDGYVARYLDRAGYFGDVKKKEARRRLPVVAQDLLGLVRAFSDDPDIRQWESYQLMERLLEEQCEVVEGDESAEDVGAASPIEVTEPRNASDVDPNDGTDVDIDSTAEDDAVVDEDATDGDGDEELATHTDGAAERDGGDTMVEDGADAAVEGSDGAAHEGGDDDDTIEGKDDAAVEASDGHTVEGDADDNAETAEATPRAVLKPARTIASDSLQSPHDPDATYGHKGKGYEVQLVETCEATNPYQVVTGVDVHGAHVSDQKATVRMVDQLAGIGLAPKTLLADTNYGSGDNIVACGQRSVDLLAPVRDPDAPTTTNHWAHPVEHGPSGEASRDTDDTPATNGQGPAMDLADFRFNATYDRMVRCPGGQVPARQETRDAPIPYRAEFDPEQCRGCPIADRCPAQELRSGLRVVRWQAKKAATATRQRQQRSSTFKEAYKLRSGVESTASEFKNRHGGAKPRVRGGARISAMAFLKAAALNTKRAVQHHVEGLIDKLDPAADPVPAPV